jgi:hypothetical protein
MHSADRAMAINFPGPGEHHARRALYRNACHRIKKLARHIRPINNARDTIGGVRDRAVANSPFNVSVNAPALSCDNDLARSFPNMTTAADKLHSCEVSDEFPLCLHTPATFMQVAINVNDFTHDRFAQIFHLAWRQPEATSHGRELFGCNSFPASRELNIQGTPTMPSTVRYFLVYHAPQFRGSRG